MIFKQMRGPMKSTMILPSKCFELSFSYLLDLFSLILAIFEKELGIAIFHFVPTFLLNNVLVKSAIMP